MLLSHGRRFFTVGPLHEDRRAFDTWHEPWLEDGPSLKLEFSRISVSRRGALTLVIDPEKGSVTKVAYSISKRSVPADAIADLKDREGTSLKNIGFVFRGNENSQYRDRESYETILAWAEQENFDTVVWTDLPSNFKEKVGQPFSVSAGISYLKTLDVTGKVQAAEYISRAPSFVQTPLRKALQNEPWFPLVL